jgi:hypothetical protein
MLNLPGMLRTAYLSQKLDRPLPTKDYDGLSPLIAIRKPRPPDYFHAAVRYHPSPDRVTTIEEGCTNHTHFSTLVQVRPARSIFSNALNFCRSAIAAFVRSP